MKKIILGGGCFWGVEAYFKRIKGVMNTRVGYTDGQVVNPTYTQVCTGLTHHVEACELVYDETVISLNRLLQHLFNIIDPTALNQQGGDVGTQYRTGIYFEEAEDETLIVTFIEQAQVNYDRPIVVEVKSATPFYDAEDYHQDYLSKNPGGYCHVNLYQIPTEELKEAYRR